MHWLKTWIIMLTRLTFMKLYELKQLKYYKEKQGKLQIRREPVEPVEEEKLRIIQTAAQLIRDEIKSAKEVYVGKNYPSVNSMTLSNTEAVILSNPKRFLSCLITNTNQSTKNDYRTLYHAGHFPKDFNNAIENRTCGSFCFQIFDRYFNQLGFCKSYKEV